MNTVIAKCYARLKVLKEYEGSQDSMNGYLKCHKLKTSSTRSRRASNPTKESEEPTSAQLLGRMNVLPSPMQSSMLTETQDGNPVQDIDWTMVIGGLEDKKKTATK